MKESVRQLRLIREMRKHFFPRFVKQPVGWRLAVRSSLRRWSGSDFYDMLNLPDGRLLLLLASGGDQGASATALVAMLRVVIHSCPMSSGQDRMPFCPLNQPALQPPHIILSHLNRVLVENTLQQQSLTALGALIAPGDNSVTYANAGYPQPRCWRANHGILETAGGPVGMPLGLNPTAAYHKRRLDLARGDILVFPSESVLTTRSSWGEEFGDGPLGEAVAEASGQTPDAVADLVLTRLKAFVSGRRPQGDLTIVVCQRTNGNGEST